MKKFAVAAVSSAALVLSASAASAALVTFGGSPSLTFADGTFTSNLSGAYPDGLSDGSAYGAGPYSAYNGYGQKGEQIRFNQAVTLQSLKLGKCNFCYDSHPTTFTVNLYNAAFVLVDSQTISASSTEETLNFDTPDVRTVEFTFDGTDHSDPYADGRDVAWYLVRDVSYALGGVPEPAVWAFMIAGFGMVGAALRRRKAVA